MSAIVPYRDRSAKIVQFAADGIAADVRALPVDRRRRTTMYAIRLASADLAVTGRLVGVRASGEIVELGDVAVAPGSIGRARLAVAMPSGGYEAVYLEIFSEHVLLRVEAPKPPARRRVHPVAAGLAVVALGTVSVGAGSIALAVPQQPMLQGPERAIAGSSVPVSYATRGYGSTGYTARFDDGVVFASGPLGAKNGRITLAVPSGAANRRVFVAITTRGPLGGASAVTSFTVAPAPPLPIANVPARVLSFAARRDPSPAGETVLASYLAVADRGVVVLQDHSGKSVASAPFAHVGTTRLPVPAVYRDQPLTARIDVAHGTTHAVASIALAPGVPKTALSTSPLPDPNAPEGVTPLDRERRGENGGILSFEGRPIAGKPLALRVMPHRTVMAVELQNASGETLAEREIGAGATHVTMPLPDSAGTYYLMLRYDRDGSQETVVRSLHVGISSR